MTTLAPSRRAIRPPSGFEDHLSRRQAAARLGFASEFKVRQLEKEGRLRPIRGVMGAAFYPPAQIEALRTASVAASRPAPPPIRPATSGGRWPDAALISLLREKPRSLVDIIVDAGIPISRAERVYRFWLTHEGPRAEPVERRSGERMTRDALVRQLRDADPQIRAAAFEKLKPAR